MIWFKDFFNQLSGLSVKTDEHMQENTVQAFIFRSLAV